MRHPDPDTIAPDAALIEALAWTTIDALPQAYRAAARAIALRVEEYQPQVHYQQVRDKWIGLRTPDGR